MFWKRKKDQAKRVPVEEQLRALAECGLELRDDDACRRTVEEWQPEDLESPPYDLILTFLGDPYDGDDGREHPISPGIWHLDTECICGPEDYVEAMQRFVTLTRGDLSLDDITAHFDDEAWVEFTLAGEKHHWDFEVSDDWIDTSIIDRFEDLLAKSGSNRRYCVQPGGQDMLLICPTREQFDRLTQLTAAKFKQLGPAW